MNNEHLMNSSLDSAATGGYKIGMVSRLTGLPRETIRTWERRYALTNPRRSPSGLRYYSAEDVSKLQLIRALSERGEAVSTLAPLGLEVLKTRLLTHDVPALVDGLASRGAPRVGVVGRHLSEQIKHVDEEFATEWVIAWHRETLAQVSGDSGVDVILYEIRDGAESALEALLSLAAARPTQVVIAIYSYLANAQIRRLMNASIKLVKGPIRSPVLVQMVHDQCALARLQARHEVVIDDAAIPEASEVPVQSPIFSPEQLAFLREIRTSVACECPSQLAAIVEGLAAFEAYSLECESRNVEDARLHGHLHREIGRIRAQAEQLLELVRRHENLILPVS